MASKNNENCDLAIYYYKRWHSAGVAWSDVYEQCSGLGKLAKKLEKEKVKIGKKLEELKEEK